MPILNLTTLCLLTLLLLPGCSKPTDIGGGLYIPPPATTIPVPSGHDLPWGYVATPQREQQIRSGFAQLKIGMTRQQVRALMGPPDQAAPCYESWNFNKYAGWHYFYNIRTTQGTTTSYDQETLLAFDPSTNCLTWTSSSSGSALKDIGTPADP